MTQRELFVKHVAQTSPSPMSIEIARAEGCYLYDVEGKIFLDLIAGISVSSLGHSDTVVIDAILEQSKKYLHVMVYGEYIQTPQVHLATLLASLLPASLSSVYFTNSGAEAIEGAMKLAKRATGRAEIISCKNAYHGSTQGALSLMSADYFTHAFLPLLPGIRHIEYNVFEDIERITHHTAAVVMEAVQAEGGAIVPHPCYLEAVRKRCDETGCLLIMDEIQTGMGRTGTLFAFEAHSCIPDILVLGKAFGAGLPLGAFISSRERMNLLTHDPVLGHITTFGGHPLCCAAALAGLQQLLALRLIEQVAIKEKLCKSYLPGLRGKGLLLALPLPSAEVTQQVITLLLEEGILTDWFLFAPDCLRIAPPLIISEEQLIQACLSIQKAVNKVIASI